MKLKAIFLIFILILSSDLSFGQKTNRKITISGNVMDAGKKPVSGAVIFIDKIKTDVKTDQKGFYKIKVSSEAKEILVFTLFNGAAEEVINGRTTIDFILKGNSAGKAEKEKTGGDNETVNIGYGTATKKDISTSIGIIDCQKPEFASYQNIYDVIRGRIPGVEVSGQTIK